MDIDSVSRLKVDIAWYILVVDSLPLLYRCCTIVVQPGRAFLI